MLLSSSVVVVLLYLAQQFGIMLGAGAEAILLVTYLVGRRDGVINETEDNVAHGIYRILLVALSCVILSGAAITYTHLTSGPNPVVFAPSYIFKWILIAIAALLSLLMQGSRIWNSALEGIAGANWGALFLIHIFAPVTTYTILTELYAGWMIVTMLLWYVLLYILHLPPLQRTIQKGSAPRIEKTPNTIAAAKPIRSFTAPPPVPTPPVPPPVVTSPPQTPPDVPIKTTIALHPEAMEGLPRVQVMPKTQQEFEDHALSSNKQTPA